MSSSRKSEEETSSYSSEALEDAKKRIKEAYDILNDETKRVCKEPEAVDETAKKLKHIHFSKMVKLNVGGHLFSTSLETLKKDSDQRQTLIDWLEEIRVFTNASDKLLYRASRNGWTAANFHSHCDNKGATVTVVESGNYIFGGYTEQHWDGTAGWKRAPDSFLFSLVNPSRLPATKMPLIAGKEDYAINCYSSYGPLFGRGNDLRIVSAPNSNSCSSSLDNDYQCPEGQNATTFLAGNKNFFVTEMEVFGFDF